MLPAALSNYWQPQDCLPLNVDWQSYRVPAGQPALAGIVVTASTASADAANMIFLNYHCSRFLCAAGMARRPTLGVSKGRYNERDILPVDD
jgi:hypothetical protein